MAPAGAEFPRGGAGRMGRPLGARLVGSGDRGGCGARGPAVAPDGGCGRPRRDRAGLRRQRRRPGPGWRGERGAAGAPPAGRVRGRLRGAGAGARAGARGGYDDPAAGPRILSPPPPPHGSPSSRLRTRHTGGESARAGEVPGRGRPPIGSPRGTGRAARGLSGRPACGDRLSPGRRGAGGWGTTSHPGSGSCGPTALGRGGGCVPQESGEAPGSFSGNSPCLLPLLSWACCCPQMTGGRRASPPGRFLPGLCVAGWCVPRRSPRRRVVCAVRDRGRCLRGSAAAAAAGWVWALPRPPGRCCCFIPMVSHR